MTTIATPCLTTRTTVTLTWDVNPDAQAYEVWRGELPAPPTYRCAILEGPTFIDPGRTPGTNYVYRVASIGLTPVETDSVTVRTRPATEYPSHVAFFNDYLSKVFAREIASGDYRWCSQWNVHPESSEAIIDLWRSYEAHRPPDDPAEPSNHHIEWRTFFAYPTMMRLLDHNGCFRSCTIGAHAIEPALPSV
jgi:hypothetical protein